MRLFLAGILHLLLVSVAFAQANGDIESIGFDRPGLYRPGCWTPMVVRLTPTSGAPFKGKIAVYQEDTDHDHVIFTRPISLGGNAAGAGGGGGDRTQRFWMYFIPQPDLLKDGNDPTAINRKLQVYLTTEDGKQLVRLLVKDQIEELDDWNRPRSTKLVLYVTNQSKPVLTPYASGRSIIGLKEPVLPVPIPISQVQSLLPESVLGYQAVDAVMWCDADPAQLSPDQRKALEEYVRRGGKLIVLQTTQPTVWEMVKKGFDEWLPVDVQGIAKVEDLTPLKRITADRAELAIAVKSRLPEWKDVDKGPYEIAIGKPKPHTVVVETEEKDGAGRPWLVRGALGMGTVTWVAQDLGDLKLTGRLNVDAATKLLKDESWKWTYVWDRVFDWGNASQPIWANDQNNGGLTPPYYRRYADAGATYHLTRSFLGGMEFPGTGAAYLGLAILFFIIYWIVAGPGSYLYLAGKKRPGMSWFAFALAALIATGATVIIVKLVLRGSAQIHHVSFVRQTPGEPTVVHTQFGLYIPRDGGQRVELQKTAADAVSYVTAYPSLTVSDEGAPPMEYEVPVFDARAVTFPYRSTLKKLQARWVGDVPQGVEGGARISKTNDTTLEGKLTNKTGRKLRHVYVVFHPRFFNTQENTAQPDQVLYLPAWDAGVTLDLATEFATRRRLIGGATPEGGPIRGDLGRPGALIGGMWDDFWYSRMSDDSNFEDRPRVAPTVPQNFAVLSLYDHVPASGHIDQGRERFEMHRSALHDLDISSAIGAGQLVILAESEPAGPLPVPISVEGDLVTGEGTTYYQFILPLDRSALVDLPTTKPATQLTTRPAEPVVSTERHP
jgi:hypothetical protein